MLGNSYFSPTVHIFSTRRFRLKYSTTLAGRICFEVTEFELLGAYMVATPSCNLGTASLIKAGETVKGLTVAAQEYFLSKSFCKILVTNF